MPRERGIIRLHVIGRWGKNTSVVQLAPSPERSTPVRAEKPDHVSRNDGGPSRRARLLTTGSQAIQHIERGTKMTRGTHNIHLAVIAALAALGLAATGGEPAFADLNQGLVGHWSFDDPANPGYDDSDHGYNGTVYGATWTSEGASGGALRFDGVDDYVGFASPVRNTAPYSVCAWVKIDSPTTALPVFPVANGGETSQSYGLCLYKNTYPTWGFGVRTQDGLATDGGTEYSPATTEWIFLCGTWDGSTDADRVKFYVNGDFVSSDTVVPAASGPALNLRIGGPSEGGPGYHFPGIIDEVRIYDRALSQDEIEELAGGAGVQTFYPSDDTYISQHDPDMNPGPRLFLRTRGLTSWRLDVLTKFDLSGIPAGTDVSSAKLRLYYYEHQDGNPIGHPLKLYRITSAWDEDTVTWNTCPFDDPTVIDTVTIPSPGVWLEWDVTGEVQAFVDGQASNFGWRLIDGDSSTNDMAYFYSKEYGSLIPYLCVDTGPGNLPPIADAGGPYSGVVGEPITFDASGSDDPDGSIVGYRWDWTNDGTWDTAWLPDPTTTHTYDAAFHGQLRLEVQDDDGATDTDTADVDVGPGGEDWAVSWCCVPPGPYDPFQLIMDQTYLIQISVVNMGDDTQTFDFGFAKDHKLLNPFFNYTTAGWEINESSRAVVYIEGLPVSYNFEEGETISVDVGAGETRQLTFTVSHHWDWIEPWHHDRILSLVLNFLLGAFEMPTEWDTAFSLLGFLGSLMDFFITPVTALEYSYTGFGDAQGIDPPLLMTVVCTRPEKVVCLGLSVIEGSAAATATAAGFAALPIPFVGWAIAAGLFASEAILWVESEWLYVQASDPDSNFTEVASPEPWDAPSLEELLPGSVKTFAELSFELLPITKAGAVSYARYLGALEADSAEWAAVQLAATRYYMEQQATLVEEMRCLSEDFIPDIPIPTPEDILETRDYLMQHGLPDIEAEILQQFGWTDGDMEALGQALLSADDTFYTSFVDMPEMLEDLRSGIAASLELLPPSVEGALSATIDVKPDTLNLASKGHWVTCYVELPNGHDPQDIDVFNVLLNGTLGAEPWPYEVGDYDNDGIPDLMVKFDRHQVAEMLEEREQAIAITGELSTEMPFGGIDFVRVIHGN